MTKRKLTHLLLIVLAILTMLAFSACSEIPVDGTNDDSTNSENLPIEEEPQGVTWSFNKATGTLTISGKGNMEDYEGMIFINGLVTNTPWNEKVELIKRVVIKEGVASIGNWAFGGCENLKSIEIPDSVTSIGYEAFYGCESLKYNKKDGVKYLGNKNNPYVVAVEADKNITSVVLPKTVKFIYYNVFEHCSSLISIEVDDGNTVYHSDNNCLIETAGKTLILGCQNSTIPDDGSVTKIDSYAFNDCSSLTSIDIPDSVTIIGAYAFAECGSLTSIEIPDSVTSIGYEAFRNCSSLTSINIPNSVTSIGSGAFYCCSSLTSITIPDSVTSIGNYAFSYCSSLASITIPDSVTKIGYGAFSYCSSLTDINYSGTKEQWATVNPENTASIPTGCVVHCTDGDIVTP